jgi:hypothetical protein
MWALKQAWSTGEIGPISRGLGLLRILCFLKTGRLGQRQREPQNAEDLRNYSGTSVWRDDGAVL